VVRSRKNGFLLNARASESSFAACLREIEKSRTLHGRLRTGAKQTACRFTEAKSAQKAMQLYTDVLRRTRRERARTEEEALGTLLKRIQVEWDLIAQKAGAIIEALTSNHPSKKSS
jgi:cell division septum initiation protein DivIVA